MEEAIQNSIFNDKLIAPCGMNCAVCIAYLREKKPCEGCRAKTENKPKHCFTCRIANCNELVKTNSGFCFDCVKYPCARVKQLDLRYRKNYQTSLIENLKQIELKGINFFLNLEVTKWTCPFCGKILSIHRDFCIFCKNNYTR